MRVRTWTVCALALVLIACGSSSSPTAPSVSVPYSQTELVVGTGAEAVNGRLVTVNYTGWLYDSTAVGNKGRQFDSSVGRAPFPFTVGSGGVIPGFSQGVTGMRVGGQRRVVIPPNLAYGSAGSQGVIPPNATLIFELELVSVQ